MRPDSVHATMDMAYLVSDRDSLRVPVELRFDLGDPLAVHITFDPGDDTSVTWRFARDLLAGGVQQPCGEGDVHIAPADPGCFDDVLIRLQVGGAAALFLCSAAPLMAFLDRTHALVPLGLEHRYSDFVARIDEALDEILAA
jgi:hypothetical protein